RPSPYDQDYTQRALAEFERFLEQYPDHPRVEEVRRARAQARDRLAKKDYENGRIYLKLGQLGPALFYFLQVQALYPETRRPRGAKVGEGKVYLKQGRWDEAQGSFESALQGSPPAEVSREATKGLEEVKKKRRPSAAPAPAPGNAGASSP